MKKIIIEGLKRDYYATEDGKIYSSYKNDFLKPHVNYKGYETVDLFISGKYKRMFVHRLILSTFCPVENMGKLQVNHIDCNKRNNNVNNLEWCTNIENQIHAIKNGLYNTEHRDYSGEKNPSAKLSEKEVLEIIDKLINKVPYSKIALEYNISKETVSAIKNKRLWKHLTKNINFN